LKIRENEGMERAMRFKRSSAVRKKKYLQCPAQVRFLLLIETGQNKHTHSKHTNKTIPHEKGKL
jgi:hypothetical protein